jgi:tRNA U55 pseudouridine synthase TruB
MNKFENDNSIVFNALDEQTKVLNNLSARLLQAELLIATLTDIMVEQNILSSEQIGKMMDEKVKVVSKKLDKIREERENKIESFPYFGGIGEA